MKIYISIPITGRPLDEAKAHAEKIRRALSGYGHEIITPFDVCPESDKPYSYYMGRDIEALLECQAIVVGTGWDKSKGCWLEFECAHIYNLKVLHEADLKFVDLNRMIYKIQ